MTFRPLQAYPLRLLAVLFILLGWCGAALAQQDTGQGQATLVATGSGSASGPPDLAVIELGIEKRDQDVSAAVEAVNQQTDAILQALREAGIAEEDLRTLSFSVRQEAPPPAPDLDQVSEMDYIVSNIVEVRVQDTSRLSEVIDAGLEAGANRVFGLRFAFAEPTPLENEALQNAVEAAQARAEVMAQAAGLALGDLIEIRDVRGGAQPFAQNAAMGIGGAGSGPPISEGQLTVTAQVEVTYSLAAESE